MKRFLIFVLAVAMVAGLSTLSFAVVPFTVDVDSNDYGGDSYQDGLRVDLEPGTYEVTVKDGAWGDWWGADGWFWSLNIYDEANDKTYYLGDSNTSYDSPQDALQAYYGNSVTITVGGASAAGEGGGALWFYVPDSSRWNNYGTVSVLVTPEPVSFILFIAGGLAMTGRIYMKRKKKAAV